LDLDVLVARPGAAGRRYRRAVARRLEVKEILPTGSGELLDNIIDYVTM